MDTKNQQSITLNVTQLGFLRLPHIIGDKKSDPPRLPLIPVSRSTWLEGVRTGKYPKPIKHGGCTFWRAEDIYALIQKIGQEA